MSTPSVPVLGATVMCRFVNLSLPAGEDTTVSRPGVRSTESFVYLKLKKQTYMWGTR